MQIGTRDLQFTIKQARNIVFFKVCVGGGADSSNKSSQAKKKPINKKKNPISSKL